MLPFHINFNDDKLECIGGPTIETRCFQTTEDNFLSVVGFLIPPDKSLPDMRFVGCIKFENKGYSLVVERMSCSIKKHSIGIYFYPPKGSKEARLQVEHDRKEVDISGIFSEDDPIFKGIIPFPECLEVSWWKQFIDASSK